MNFFDVWLIIFCFKNLGGDLGGSLLKINITNTRAQQLLNY